MSLATLLSLAAQTVAVFVAATFVADVVHFALHRLAGLALCRSKLAEAALPLALVAASLPWVAWPAVAAAGAMIAGHFLWAATRPVLTKVPAPLRSLGVDQAYCALHAAFPDRFYSRVATTFDRLFATGVALKGRRVVMTGASGAFGAPLKVLLEAEGATVTALKYGVDFTYDDYAKCDAALAQADIVVLAHGAKKEQAMAANADSFVHFIERFRALTLDRTLPPEVWAVGSEIECHPSWGNADLEIYLQSKRAFARHARRYFHDPNLLYRHIVPSAFTSPMGPGLISGRLAAAWAFFFISRGFRYIPVSYTGIALLNYFKFVFRVHAVPDPNPQQRRLDSTRS